MCGNKLPRIVTNNTHVIGDFEGTIFQANSDDTVDSNFVDIVYIEGVKSLWNNFRFPQAIVMQGFPEFAEVIKASVQLCRRNAESEEKSYGKMPPCRKMSPLSPPLRLDEYFMMERDEGKC